MEKLPNYIDLFGEEVATKRDKFIQYLTKGVKLDFLESDYRIQFEKFFVPLTEDYLSKDNYKAIAIDASGNKREFWNGVYFFVQRACGVVNNGEILRELEADVFAISGQPTEAETYIGWKAEYLEFKVLDDFLRYIDDSDGRPRFCFIDGSLYARLMHFIVESTVKGDEYYILKYLDYYCEILTKARKKNLVLIGVSKDSRAKFFRNGLLDEIYYEEIDKIKSEIHEAELLLIKSVIKNIDEPKKLEVNKFKQLIANNPKLLKKIDQIFREYNTVRTNGEILYRFANIEGFTMPMEMGLGRPYQKKIFKKIESDPGSLVSKLFKKYIDAIPEKEEEEFVKKGAKILSKMLEMPTFMSFHLVPDIRDVPLKIDVPSWYFEKWNKISEFKFVKFIDHIDPFFKVIIGFIMKLYGGVDNYNILLTNAHDNAVLKLEKFNSVYEKLLEDNLKILFPYKRRTKRMTR